MRQPQSRRQPAELRIVDGNGQLVRDVFTDSVGNFWSLGTPSYVYPGFGVHDAWIDEDGKSVYFANRDLDFLLSFRAEPKTGALTLIGRSSCGGKIPRNFVLDPSERWMLVANQNSNAVSVFSRNPETGALADKGQSFPVQSPMCILFA